MLYSLEEVHVCIRYFKSFPRPLSSPNLSMKHELAGEGTVTGMFRCYHSSTPGGILSRVRFWLRSCFVFADRTLIVVRCPADTDVEVLMM